GVHVADAVIAQTNALRVSDLDAVGTGGRGGRRAAAAQLHAVDVITGIQATRVDRELVTVEDQRHAVQLVLVRRRHCQGCAIDYPSGTVLRHCVIAAVGAIIEHVACIHGQRPLAGVVRIEGLAERADRIPRSQALDADRGGGRDRAVVSAFVAGCVEYQCLGRDGCGGRRVRQQRVIARIRTGQGACDVHHLGGAGVLVGETTGSREGDVIAYNHAAQRTADRGRRRAVVHLTACGDVTRERLWSYVCGSRGVRGERVVSRVDSGQQSADVHHLGGAGVLVGETTAGREGDVVAHDQPGQRTADHSRCRAVVNLIAGSDVTRERFRRYVCGSRGVRRERVVVGVRAGEHAADVHCLGGTDVLVEESTVGSQADVIAENRATQRPTERSRCRAVIRFATRRDAAGNGPRGDAGGGRGIR